MEELRKAAQIINAWYEKNIASCRLAGLALALAGYCYGVIFWYNMDSKEINCIAAEKAQVGKEYQRREDLAQNMANIVNNYANHERILFQYVADMRAEFQALEMSEGAPTVAQGAKIELAFLKLAALAEQYPELKAEQRFHDLMDMAEATENRIADSMYLYIDAVLDYNICNQRFWCPYFTYSLSSLIVARPSYWEYYHTGHKYAPVVQADAPNAQGVEQKNEAPADAEAGSRAAAGSS